ncbi:MAG: serine/threonine-protein kinase, partial [Burkholderiales bacterium]
MGEPLPEHIGRYRVLGELGRGAMGVVYRAEDPMLNRTVAIKTILLSSDPVVRAEYEARFRQEAKAAGGLNHPNLITIYDVGREGDMAYMAMELLEGVELRGMMKAGRLELPFVLEILAQVADGLAFAHERGVVHRDVKPGNIMIVGERRAKVMDFGVARMRASDIETQVGAVLGSPKYMSPEQVSGAPIDGRSDVFSLGVMLYELATGAPPFSAPDVQQYMLQIAGATR